MSGWGESVDNKTPRWFLILVFGIAFSIFGFILKNAYGDIELNKKAINQYSVLFPVLEKRIDKIDEKLDRILMAVKN